jgi:hypothetical protein
MLSLTSNKHAASSGTVALASTWAEKRAARAAKHTASSTVPAKKEANAPKGATFLNVLLLSPMHTITGASGKSVHKCTGVYFDPAEVRGHDGVYSRTSADGSGVELQWLMSHDKQMFPYVPFNERGMRPDSAGGPAPPAEDDTTQTRLVPGPGDQVKWRYSTTVRPGLPAFTFTVAAVPDTAPFKCFSIVRLSGVRYSSTFDSMEYGPEMKAKGIHTTGRTLPVKTKQQVMHSMAAMLPRTPLLKVTAPMAEALSLPKTTANKEARAAAGRVIYGTRHISLTGVTYEDCMHHMGKDTKVAVEYTVRVSDEEGSCCRFKEGQNGEDGSWEARRCFNISGTQTAVDPEGPPDAEPKDLQFHCQLEPHPGALVDALGGNDNPAAVDHIVVHLLGRGQVPMGGPVSLNAKSSAASVSDPADHGGATEVCLDMWSGMWVDQLRFCQLYCFELTAQEAQTLAGSSQRGTCLRSSWRSKSDKSNWQWNNTSADGRLAAMQPYISLDRAGGVSAGLCAAAEAQGYTFHAVPLWPCDHEEVRAALTAAGETGSQFILGNSSLQKTHLAVPKGKHGNFLVGSVAMINLKLWNGDAAPTAAESASAAAVQAATEQAPPLIEELSDQQLLAAGDAAEAAEAADTQAERPTPQTTAEAGGDAESEDDGADTADTQLTPGRSPAPQARKRARQATPVPQAAASAESDSDSGGGGGGGGGPGADEIEDSGSGTAAPPAKRARKAGGKRARRR